MTREQICEQAYLNVIKGLPTPDISIERLDVFSYFNAALPAAIENEWESRSLFATKQGREYITDEEFVQQFVLNLVDGDCLRYAVFSPRYQGLPENGGVRNVYSKDFSTQFVKLKGLSQLQGFDLPSPVCWFGEMDGEQRVYVKNISPDVEQVLVEVVVLADDIAKTDRVVAPGQVIDGVIRMMTEFFMNQKGVQDVINDSSDTIQQNGV